MKTSLFGVLATLLAMLPIASGAQSHCSREALPVRGSVVSITYCVNGSPGRAPGLTTLQVTGTYESSGGRYSREHTMRFVGGEGPARTIDDVELAPLGLTGTLHLTLLYLGDRVQIETALLTPGAVVVK